MFKPIFVVGENGHQDNQIENNVGAPRLGKVEITRDLCIDYLWPKGQLTEEWVKAEGKGAN